MARKNKNPKSDFECEIITDVCEFTDEPVLPKGCKNVNSFSFEEDADTPASDIYNSSTNNINFTNTNSSNSSNDNNNNNIDTNTDYVETTPPATDSASQIRSSSRTEQLQTISPLEDNRRTPIANGAAPAIDGEAPAIRRTYVLRASTIRKINEIKSIHPDIGICVSTIVDMAIDYYYTNVH